MFALDFPPLGHIVDWPGFAGTEGAWYEFNKVALVCMLVVWRRFQSTTLERFTIALGFDATYKEGGRRAMKEVCVYEVKNDKIVREQFFYAAT